MGKQPAVIIIARHGARLDAADKSWHLSSPTPYDPPLTYGGWTQSRALGLRIASLLHAREDSLTGDVPAEPHELTVGNGSHDSVAPEVKPPTRKRKHKIYVHSSPFQRCVQTGIGISAGISQYQSVRAGRARSDSKPRSSREFQPSPRLHAVDATAASVAARSHLIKSLKHQPKQGKTSLRIDAYLGEWLSPDYFDLITPPPNSTMMVAGAKADLLRRGEDMASFSLSPGPSTPGAGGKQSQGNLWTGGKGPEPTSAPHLADGPLDMKSLSQALPGRDRTSSYSSGRVSPFGRPVLQRAVSSEVLPDLGYNPPNPNYAISPVEPIPRGYVAHARDACVDVDYQWDSMRPPLLWGDGGEYGEEWSAMHKRFRKGLNHLIDWYGENESGQIPDDHEAVPGVEDHDHHDADEDIVVVLVTHGAGCNALIGALTEQPVLLDVGMASMTMAVRKEERVNGHEPHHDMPQIASPTSSPTVDRGARRNGSISTGLSQKYDMKIVASSEHLRPGADPTRPATPTPSSPSLAASKTVPESRRRSTLLSSHAAAGSPLEVNWAVTEHPRPHNMSAALGSIRRLSMQNMGPPQRSGSVSSATSATGLWMPSTPPLPEARAEKEMPGDRQSSPVRDPVDLSGVEPDNKLGISYVPDSRLGAPLVPTRPKSEDPTSVPRISTTTDSPSREMRDSVSELPGTTAQMPSSIGRKLSQKGLWGSAPSGNYERDRTPKRRWTLQQE
ncbi:hypothetical protein BDZ85DRAFT_4447 [Elsinoe ampelina]|uniref:Histidine phosphatase superfamily n=1 Tax=Elsinoe ampelina TaxID=302913 RepID=A0A6A6GPM1_9PEZI|nr:hypothetical protein BDZ85DRAFT_4447 [Elsinoe ampelina]